MLGEDPERKRQSFPEILALIKRVFEGRWLRELRNRNPLKLNLVTLEETEGHTSPLAAARILVSPFVECGDILAFKIKYILQPVND